MQWCVNAYCQSHSPYLMILTLSEKTGKGNLLSSPVNNYAYAVQRLNVTIISPWVYLETNLMCIEICWFFFLIIILMGSEWGFLIREKSCSILKSYRSTFESQVVLKKKQNKPEMGFWCPLSCLRKNSHKIFSYIMKRWWLDRD